MADSGRKSLRLTIRRKSSIAITPQKKNLIRAECYEVVNKTPTKGNMEPSVRRMVVDSPVTTGSLTMSPNPEIYFLADNRIKYRKQSQKSDIVMNDAMKGKMKRRKKRLAPKAEERLPERELPANFSVTAEAMKVKVDQDEFISGNTHDEEVQQLIRDIVDNQFPDWIGLYRDGFNVMIYGYGSKLPIFREFEKYVGENHLVVRVNGLFPKLNARKFLYGVCENAAPNERFPHGSNLEGLSKDIVKVLNASNHPEVFILVNNFDILALRQPQMLSMLCALAQVKFIKILASCDTVTAFLGVTQSQSLLLKFCWMHCPTYKQYHQELKWTPGIYGGEAMSVTQKSSLKYVLQSLTGNARKAFAILAEMQLKQMKIHANKRSKDKEGFAGVRFQELAKDCREKFIAHSDDNLRTLLVEFFDHKLIRQTGKGKHVENMLLIELDMDTLEEIIHELI